jgi:hypothetical protein
MGSPGIAAEQQHVCLSEANRMLKLGTTGLLKAQPPLNRQESTVQAMWPGQSSRWELQRQIDMQQP